MGLAQKIARIAGNPRLARDYLGWLAGGGAWGDPERALFGGIKLGSFANFSEYHMVPAFVNEDERRFLEEYPIGDGAIIDVGANVGLVSLLLARRFPDREIHAFEPNPTTFAALEANAKRNHASRLHCHRFAVSDADGSILFDNDPVKRGTASISNDRRRGAHAVEVPAITLDRFVGDRAIDRVGLLKIDVEGFETLVLGGAHHLLATIRPAAIYFEVCPVLTDRSGFPVDGPARTLVEAGYALHRFDDAGRWRPATPDEVAGVRLENWLATPA